MKIAVVAGYAPSLVNFRREVLREITARGHRVIALAPENDESVRRALSADGVAFHAFPLVRNAITPIHDLETVVYLSRFFRRHRIRLVFGYTIKPVVYGSIAAAAAGVPNISSMITGLGYAFTEVHGLKRRLVRSVAEELYRRGLSKCEKVIFQNDDDRLEFEQRNLVSPRNVISVVNGSGVDLKHHFPQPIPEGAPHFLVIARLLREKGIREFAAAARLVRHAIPEATFEVVGPDDASPGGLSKFERQEAEDAGVHFSGPVSDVRRAIGRSTCFVLPSYREGTPRTVLEAMAAARPIVTTDVPGCRQTTVHNETGLLVPARDHHALADAMIKLGSNKRLSLDFGMAARRRVEEVYDVHHVAAATVDAILQNISTQETGS